MDTMKIEASSNVRFPELSELPVGSRIYFAEEKLPYRIRARSNRYLVCTKPFNLRKTVLYTIVDLVEGIRGAENLILGFGAETNEQCANMINRLEGRSEEISAEVLSEIRKIIPDFDPGPPIQTEISYRNRIPARIVRVVK